MIVYRVRRWVRCPHCQASERRWIKRRGLTRCTCLACDQPYLANCQFRVIYTETTFAQTQRIAGSSRPLTAGRRYW